MDAHQKHWNYYGIHGFPLGGEGRDERPCDASVAVGAAARVRCARRPATPAGRVPHAHAATPGCRRTAANPTFRGRSSPRRPTFPTYRSCGGRCRGRVASCGRAWALESPVMRWSNGPCPMGPSRAPRAEPCRPPAAPEPPAPHGPRSRLRSARRCSARLRQLRLASGGGGSADG